MRCVRNLMGEVLGAYRVPNDALALDGGFATFAAWTEAEGMSPALFVVSDAEALLQAKGRKLHGRTVNGYAWYDAAMNASMLASEGRAGHYEPHPDACSPFYPTAAQAAFHALRD